MISSAHLSLSRRSIWPLLSVSIGLWLIAGDNAAADTPGNKVARYRVGLAKVDITPNYPVRLNGFGNRREESEGVSQRVFVRAMAISQDDAPPLVVLAVDNLGVRSTHVAEIARRLKTRFALPAENLAVTFTHTHCAPKLHGASDNIFSSPIPEDHQRHIERYTTQAVNGMTEAAEKAIAGRQRARLDWAVGEVGFAKNRRPQGGPVDHDLPVLLVRSPDGKQLRGAYVSYACHCVTLRFNKISGDWAGYAAELIERQHPGAVALVSIGAGSDQNPSQVSPDDSQVALRQGAEIADEVKRVAAGPLKAIQGTPQATLKRIPLPLNPLPTKKQFEETAMNGPRPTDRHNAKTQIEKN